MRRRAVEVEIIFFDVLAVVALAVGQTEESLLQNGVFPVPEGERKTDPLLVVADACHAILAPTIGAGSCLIVSKKIPGVTVIAVILPNSSPLPFGQVGAPEFPCRRAVTRLLETA